MAHSGLLDLVLDPGSWQSWDEPPVAVSTSPDYAAQLAAARERTGLDESVTTGEGRIAGRRVASLPASSTSWLGRSGWRQPSAWCADRTRHGRAAPLLAAPVSGGTRMQEGTVAFLQMVKIAAAVAAHRARGLPYLVYLRHPTTGGVFASWGSLGHLTVAERGGSSASSDRACTRRCTDGPFPAGVQRAENLYAHGLVDAVLPAEAMAQIADRTLTVLLAEPPGGPAARPRAAEGAAGGRVCLGVDPHLSASRPARCTAAAALRRVRRRPAQRHR